MRAAEPNRSAGVNQARPPCAIDGYEGARSIEVSERSCSVRLVMVRGLASDFHERDFVRLHDEFQGHASLSDFHGFDLKMRLADVFDVAYVAAREGIAVSQLSPKIENASHMRVDPPCPNLVAAVLHTCKHDSPLDDRIVFEALGQQLFGDGIFLGFEVVVAELPLVMGDDVVIAPAVGRHHEAVAR